MATKKSTKKAAKKTTKKAGPKKKAQATKVSKQAKKIAKKATKTVKKAAKTLAKAAKKVVKSVKKVEKKVEKTVATAVRKTPAARGTKKAPVKNAAAGGEGASLVGKKAPAFKLEDQSGNVVSSSSLEGKPYVLYFYPKDDTPGCTKESCDFRDGEGNFRRAGVTVLGVSPDSAKSHAGFAKKYNLPFTLLSDPEKKLAGAYGTWALKKNYGREYWGIVRSTFLIGADGKIKKEWRGVKVGGHVDAVLAEAKS